MAITRAMASRCARTETSFSKTCFFLGLVLVATTVMQLFAIAVTR